MPRIIPTAWLNLIPKSGGTSHSAGPAFAESPPDLRHKMPYRNGLNRACGRRAAETLRLHQTCGELCKYDRPDISRLGLVSRGYAAPSDVQKLAGVCPEIGQAECLLRENDF